MKKTKNLILISLIICILSASALADVGDWNSYDSYDSYDYSSNDDDDYSWDDDDDYSYSSNDDDYDNSTKVEITDESYEYDESWENPVVIPVEGYTYIEYKNTTPNYYLYYLSNDKESKTVRIKKTALSYDYDVIYDKDTYNYTINNPLGKKVKKETFNLSSEYELCLHEDIYPKNDKIKSYILNDYIYLKNKSEKGEEVIYKVNTDLIKFNSIEYQGILLNTRKYTYLFSVEELGRSNITNMGNEYYMNYETGEIIETTGFIIPIDAKEDWMMPFQAIGQLILGILCSCFWPIVVVVIIFWSNKKKKKNTNYAPSSNDTVLPKIDLSSIDTLEQNDPNFNKDEFMQWVDSVFMELQTAWTNKDVEKIKTLEDNALYATHKAQLERYIKDKKTNYIERIAIRDKAINGYKEDDGFEFIDLTLTVEMVDYIKDDVTGNVIKGRTEDRLMMEYNIVFKRKKGVKTDSVGELETVNCPSCGAPIDISASAVCEYCNNVVNTSNHSWVISQYKGRNVYR